MTEFKGLSIPAIMAEDNTDLGRQRAACKSTDAEECAPLACMHCIFDADNLKAFLEWEV